METGSELCTPAAVGAIGPAGTNVPEDTCAASGLATDVAE
jgi:hypothetical protein